MHVHINTFEAIKDIAAGQEIFNRYGGAEWFESKNLQKPTKVRFVHKNIDSYLSESVLTTS